MKGKDKVDLDVLKHADAFDHYKFWEPKNKSGSLSRKLQSEAWIDGIKGQFPNPLMIFSTVFPSLREGLDLGEKKTPEHWMFRRNMKGCRWNLRLTFMVEQQSSWKTV
jgi:hypothetical protein